MLRHPFRQGSADVASSGEHLGCRGDQFGGGAHLGEVSDGAQGKGTDGVLFLRMHGEDQNRLFGMGAPQGFQEIHSLDVRQREVQQHQVVVAGGGHA